MRNLNGRKSLVVALLAIVILLLFSKIGWAWRTFEKETPKDSTMDAHKMMTWQAISFLNNMVSTDPQTGETTKNYPDIYRFTSDILDGSGGYLNDFPFDPDLINFLKSQGIFLELGSIHYNPRIPILDDKYDYTGQCKTKFNKYILDDFKERKFSEPTEAYWWLGNIAHLTEDSSSPPHAFACHGTGSFPLYEDKWPPGDQIEYHGSQLEDMSGLGRRKRGQPPFFCINRKLFNTI